MENTQIWQAENTILKRTRHSSRRGVLKYVRLLSFIWNALRTFVCLDVENLNKSHSQIVTFPFPNFASSGTAQIPMKWALHALPPSTKHHNSLGLNFSWQWVQQSSLWRKNKWGSKVLCRIQHMISCSSLNVSPLNSLLDCFSFCTNCLGFLCEVVAWLF